MLTAEEKLSKIRSLTVNCDASVEEDDSKESYMKCMHSLISYIYGITAENADTDVGDG